MLEWALLNEPDIRLQMVECEGAVAGQIALPKPFRCFSKKQNIYLFKNSCNLLKNGCNACCMSQPMGGHKACEFEFGGGFFNQEKLTLDMFQVAQMGKVSPFF